MRRATWKMTALALDKALEREITKARRFKESADRAWGFFSEAVENYEHQCEKARENEAALIEARAKATQWETVAKRLAETIEAMQKRIKELEEQVKPNE